MTKQKNAIDNNEHCCIECLHFRIEPPQWRLVCNKNSLRILCGVLHTNNCGDWVSKQQIEENKL